MTAEAILSTLASEESGAHRLSSWPRAAEAAPAVVQSRVEAALRSGWLASRLRRVVRLMLGLASVR